MKRGFPIGEMLLLLVLACVYLPSVRFPRMFMWDEAEYASLGRSLARDDRYAIGGHPQGNRVPVLPMAIAGFLRIAGPTADAAVRSPAAAVRSPDSTVRSPDSTVRYSDSPVCYSDSAVRYSDAAVRCVPVAFAMLTLAIVMVFGRMTADRLTAGVAVILCAMAPAFWLRTPQVLTDIAFAGFFAAAVWSFHFALERDARWMWPSAVLAAVSFLTRYTAALFIPFALILAAAAVIRSRKAVPRLVSGHTFGATLLALGLIAPWFVRSYRLFGDPLIGLRWAGEQVQVYAPGLSFPWSYYLQALPAMFSLPTVVCLAAGIVLAVHSRDHFAIDSILAAGALLLYFSFFRYKEDRFVLAIVPLLAVVAARGLIHLATRLSGGRHPRLAAGVVLAIIIPFTAVPAIAFLRRAPSDGSVSFLRAAEFVRRASPPGSVVLSSSGPQIAWYCDRRTAAIPAEQGRLADAARGAALIVVTNFEPGQPAWAIAFAEAAARDPRCGVRFFTDKGWTTAVIPAGCVSQPVN